jgi:hypothetical protein
MNKEAIIFNLMQATAQIQEITKKTRAGFYDDSGNIALASDMTNVLNYLNNSWHYREMTDVEINLLSQEEYEKLAFSIPIYDGRFLLQDP